MALVAEHGNDGATLRWVRRTSSAESAAANIAAIVIITTALVTLKGNHPITWALIGGTLLIRFLRMFLLAQDYELALRDGAIEWGNTASPTDRSTFPLSDVASVTFYRRNTGTGALEVAEADGRRWMLPGDFTDQPGVSETLLAKLKELRPELEVHVK